MNVGDLISLLRKCDKDKKVFWHDAIEGNDCELSSIFIVNHDTNEEYSGVYISPMTKEMIESDFHYENMDAEFIGKGE